MREAVLEQVVHELRDVIELDVPQRLLCDRDLDFRRCLGGRHHVQQAVEAPAAAEGR